MPTIETYIHALCSVCSWICYDFNSSCVGKHYCNSHIPKTICFHKLHPHAIRGLTKSSILHFVHDMVHDVCLMIVVQNVIDYGFAWFPKIHQSDENVFSSWHHLLGFLGFNQCWAILKGGLKFSKVFRLIFKLKTTNSQIGSTSNWKLDHRFYS